MEDLLGRFVMVEPSLANYVTHGAAKIGIITKADPENDIFEVEFHERWRENHSASFLRVFKPSDEIKLAMLTTKLNRKDRSILIPICFSAEYGTAGSEPYALAALLDGKKAIDIATEYLRDLIGRSPDRPHSRFGYGR